LLSWVLELHRLWELHCVQRRDVESVWIDVKRSVYLLQSWDLELRWRSLHCVRRGYGKQRAGRDVELNVRCVPPRNFQYERLVNMHSLPRRDVQRCDEVDVELELSQLPGRYVEWSDWCYLQQRLL
jgi:hypothetical protein